jgi:hypothetical protein
MSALEFLSGGTKSKFGSAFADVNVSVHGSPSSSTASIPSLESRISVAHSTSERPLADRISFAPAPNTEPHSLESRLSSAPPASPPPPPTASPALDRPYWAATTPAAPVSGKPILSEALLNSCVPGKHTWLIGVSLPPSPSAPKAHHCMWQWCQNNVASRAPIYLAPPNATIRPGFRVRMTVDVYVDTKAEAEELRKMAPRCAPVWLERMKK